ncbi:MAG: hypothetical protein KKD05_02050 [Candidatus Omnitrophica bacterium]|nr:hypothetical protein [Candidatus Omnitrophota bacterium]
MNKIAKNKNQVLKILNQMAAKHFSTNEKIALVVILIICVLISNHLFNNWIISLKNKNSVVISIVPKIEPELPVPIIGKQGKIEDLLEPEIKVNTIRDPFLSSKNPEQIKTVLQKRPAVELRLSGILWDDKIPSAIINSNVVKIGDLIEGKTVVDIEKTQVIIMEDGKIQIIELRNQ